MSAPTLSGISPATGNTGTVVTLAGTNFTGATAVLFGTTPATGFVVNSATQIVAVAPAGLGIPDITVVTPGGTSATSSADQFTYAGFVPRDIIVKLNVFPWELLVRNHNGVRAEVVDSVYTRGDTYRNTLPGGAIQIEGAEATNLTVVPAGGPVTSPLDLTTGGVIILDDPTSEAAGLTGFEPRPRLSTRYKYYFGTVDQPAPGAGSTYHCWKDEYAGVSDVDPNNELADQAP